MVAAELVSDREGREPDSALRDAGADRAFHNGLLLLGAGKRAVGFMPPLNVTAAECGGALALLDQSLHEAVAFR